MPVRLVDRHFCRCQLPLHPGEFSLICGGQAVSLASSGFGDIQIKHGAVDIFGSRPALVLVINNF
jgi:hypothetical protein